MGWGSSTRRGGGQKVRALPRKFVFLGFRRQESGMSQEFCRDVPDPRPGGVQKVCAKKVRAHFSFPIFRKTREGWNCRFFKTSRTEGWGQGLGSVDPRFPAGWPFPVPQILEFIAFRDSGKIFQQFSRDFPEIFLQKNPRTDPGNSHSLAIGPAPHRVSRALREPRKSPKRVPKESPEQGPKSPERAHPGVPKESEKSPKVRF